VIVLDFNKINNGGANLNNFLKHVSATSSGLICLSIIVPIYPICLALALVLFVGSLPCNFNLET
jgi:hypothetical protein